MKVNALRKFLQFEAAGGVMLFFAALIAILWANSPWKSSYFASMEVSSLRHWVNDGLMTLFFLLVGLELKREFLIGELSGLGKILLPASAALGGMVIPAFIYISMNSADSIALRGWAIPVATDIAFALGVLSLFNKRIPLALKLFLLALAIFDDLGAIVIIALFYAHSLSWIYLAGAFLTLFCLFLLNRCKVTYLWLYLLLGGLLWFFVWRSGIHASISGVLLALMVPITSLPDLEKKLHPWVAFGILPIFALCNAGFSLEGMTWNVLLSPVVVGIIAGLFLGKQIGVMMCVWLMTSFRIIKWPDTITFLDIYGVALLCGIGFTMSLFLGNLAFQAEHPIYLAEVRCGVFLGSLLSAICGSFVLQVAILQKRKRRFSS